MLAIVSGISQTVVFAQVENNFHNNLQVKIRYFASSYYCDGLLVLHAVSVMFLDDL